MDKPQSMSNKIGFLKGFTNQIRLIGHLMADRRVSPFLKLLPVAGIIYWIVPTDLMPGLPFDDAAVLWLTGTMFLELCPQDIVHEHRLAIEQATSGIVDPPMGATQSTPPAADVVDAEFYDVSGSERKP